MTSVFNPDEFLSATHTGGFETRRPTLPEKEYLGQLLDGKAGMDVKTVNTKDGTRYVLSMNWGIVDDEAKALTGLDTPRVKQDIWLDVDEHGRLIKDKTHNIDLGRFLSGIGLNLDTFSFLQVRSVGLCKLKVGLSKENDKGDRFNEVRAAVKYNGAN